MKYIVLVPDGMADEPLHELGGKTPLEAARTPHMDRLAAQGMTGLVQTIPEGMAPGSDIGNLALLGYDPAANFSGRAPLEAANQGIILKDDEVAFRCNLVTVETDIMKDYSAGHISDEEAAALIKALNATLGNPDIRFYPGKSYRHLMVVKSDRVETLSNIKCTPPHDILNQAIAPHLPKGEGEDLLRGLMDRSKDVLRGHDVNELRRSTGQDAATMIWLWGQGKRPNLPLFKEKFGLHGAIISAVDLVNGIGRLAGLDVISVPGANGYYDTNYKGKAQYALDALKTKDFVYVHVEAPDEAGHNGDWKNKMKCIERIDEEVVAPIVQAMAGEEFRILVSPDHPTPVVKRTHTRAPVCFLMCGTGIPSGGATAYSEAVAGRVGLKFKSGSAMIDHFLEQ